MAYTNSSLVTYKNLTKNKTANRKHAIDTITIHCYVGQVTAKQGCDYFATTTREVSANYVVGKDGSIGLSVEEKDRAWTSSKESKPSFLKRSRMRCRWPVWSCMNFSPQQTDFSCYFLNIL